MIKSKKNDETYITGFESNNKNADLLNIKTSLKKTNSPNKTKNFKTLQYSTPMHNQKLLSLAFPLIKPQGKKIFSILYDSKHKSLNKNSKLNFLEISDKNKKKLEKILSKVNYNKRDKLKKKLIQIKFNSNSIDKSNKKINYNSIISSPGKNNENSKHKIYNIKSAKINKKNLIKNIEFNLNLKKTNSNYILSSRLKNILDDTSPSSKTTKQKPLIIFNHKKRVFHLFQKSKKTKPILEKSQNQLYTYSLKRYSPRLLRKKEEKKIISLNKRNIINDDGCKIQTTVFKNQIIPYLNKIDISNISNNLPPITLGSRYSIPQKTEEVIKREEFNDKINNIIKNMNKKKHLNSKINLNKKEILSMIRRRNLKFCNENVHKTEELAISTKNRIIKDYNCLKLSLNQFDDWDSPENKDNLYE